MRRTLTLAGTWAAATTAAVGLAWAGVGIVSDQVSEPVRTVAASSPALSPSPTSSPSPTASPSASPTPTATPEPSLGLGPSDEPSDGASAPGATSTPRASDAPAPRPSPSVAPAPGASPSAAPSPSSSPSTTATAPAETRSYQLVGGTVTVRYSSTLVEVLVATPADGFETEIDRDGPTDLKVEFESETHRSRLDAEWEDGAPRDRIREEPR